MEKSSYNERFVFDDPLCSTSASRTTRYRIQKKRRLLPESEEEQSQQLDDQSAIPWNDAGCISGVRNSDSVLDHTSMLSIGDTVSTVSESLFSGDCTDDEEVLFDERFADVVDNAETGDSDIDDIEDDIQVTVDEELPSSSAVPLYDGSSLTITASSIVVMKYVQRHNLTKEALADFLSILRLHCPLSNRCPATPYLFYKQFAELKYTTIFHYFCSVCLERLPDKNVTHCTNSACGIVLDDALKSSFIEVPIDQQLQTILQRMSSAVLN